MKPQKDKRFNVFTVSHGNPHRCNPFICTDKDYAFIYGDDEEKPIAKWIFRKSKFVFKEIRNGKESIK